MSYPGETYRIPCNRGGYFASPNLDNIPPEAMVGPTRNLNLHNEGREKRGGTAKVNSTAITGSPRIMGLHDFRLENGTGFLVVATSDGKIYKDFTTTIKTGLGTSKVSGFEVFNNEIYFFNGFNRPQTWDGVAASTSDLTSIPTDWTGSNFPRQMIARGRGGVTGTGTRLWALALPGTNRKVYASKLNDGHDLSDANVIVFDISTGDGFGIVGGIVYGNRLIALGKRKAFIIDDSDPSTANWGYEPVQWDGGVAHYKLIVKTPNDIICMMEDGEIYSISATQQYGDYIRASLTRPSFMYKWIKDNVNFIYLDDFHAIYDPQIRAIKIWVVRNGKTTVDTALVYFIDRDPKEAWMIHDNQNYNSGYSASASTVVRVNPGEHRVYTGDYSGFVWKTEQVNKNDGGNCYYAGFRTPILDYGSPRTTKFYRRGRIVAIAKGDFQVQIQWWVDGVQQSSLAVNLNTGPASSDVLLDDFML